MIARRAAVFLLNLVQDLAVLRPLMIMAHRDFGFEVRILASAKFRSRDMFGIWEAELDILRAQTNARVTIYRTDLEAWGELRGTGILFSASESSVPEHEAAHAAFRYAPPSFLKVTLQHGFECVGFQHSAAHDLTYGPTASFAADILCAWQPPDKLRSLAPSQVSKVEVTGPSGVLQSFGGKRARDSLGRGLVCENLHSVRLRSATGSSDEFLSTFRQFSEAMDERGRRIILRPHPGGQFVLKNKVDLPPNVEINNAPIYRLDLRSLDYGISAPSSVLIDLLLADVPTAIWRDSRGAVDTRNYEGLTTVSSSAEWCEFASEASRAPDAFLKPQRRFLEQQRMPIEPADVFARYSKVFQAVDRLEVRSGTRGIERQRLLIVANAHLPTVQVCIERPLRSLVRSGELVIELLTEGRLVQQAKLLGSETGIANWVHEALDAFGPDTVMFSRYSGPYAESIVEWARRNGVPIIYQIDDDLLAVPRELGDSKYAYHNDPSRIATVRYLLGEADLVYASTPVLEERLSNRFPGLPVTAGVINASGSVLRRPRNGPATVIGYMASADHYPNLAMVLPAITALLENHPRLTFELFGSIPTPPELDRFGDRVRRIAPVQDYELFLDALGDRTWDVGICPLVPTEFNRAKSNNKWIEYTSVGTAVVASAGMVYDRCCADDCGVLAESLDEWASALDSLVRDDAERVAIVLRAQRKLETEYGIAEHRRQILEILESARERAGSDLVEENA